MILEDGPVYTPEQITENGWLGPISPNAIRKAVTRGDFECTRIRNKIGMTKANILANQAKGFEPAKVDRPSYASGPPRKRRAPAAPTESSVTVLRPRPGAARKSRRRAS